MTTTTVAGPTYHGANPTRSTFVLATAYLQDPEKSFISLNVSFFVCKTGIQSSIFPIRVATMARCIQNYTWQTGNILYRLLLLYLNSLKNYFWLLKGRALWMGGHNKETGDKEPWDEYLPSPKIYTEQKRPECRCGDGIVWKYKVNNMAQASRYCQRSYLFWKCTKHYFLQTNASHYWPRFMSTEKLWMRFKMMSLP